MTKCTLKKRNPSCGALERPLMEMGALEVEFPLGPTISMVEVNKVWQIMNHKIASDMFKSDCKSFSQGSGGFLKNSHWVPQWLKMRPVSFLKVYWTCKQDAASIQRLFI